MLDSGPVLKIVQASALIAAIAICFGLPKWAYERRLELAPQLPVTGQIALIDRVFDHQHITNRVESLADGQKFGGGLVVRVEIDRHLERWRYRGDRFDGFTMGSLVQPFTFIAK